MLLQMRKDMKDCAAATAFCRNYLILQSIEAFKDELKHGVEVVWARGGYKNIGIAGKNFRGSLEKKNK